VWQSYEDEVAHLPASILAAFLLPQSRDLLCFQVPHHCSIILAGDPKQLGATIRDPVAARMGLGLSLQERLLKLPLYTCGKFDVMTNLVNNYRSNDALLTVPSSLFYGGSLEALAPDEVANPFENFGDLGPAGFPLLLCDVAHGKERSKMDTPSFYNMEECNAILSLAQGLLLCKTKEGVSPLHTGQISVITPFRAQVLALRSVLRAANLGGINVGVVEDFQGQEAKVVFISTVLTQDHERWTRPAETTVTSDEASRSTQKHRLGFLFDPKKFNVAVTRAQALCIIVGHAEYLEQSGTYLHQILVLGHHIHVRVILHQILVLGHIPIIVVASLGLGLIASLGPICIVGPIIVVRLGLICVGPIILIPIGPICVVMVGRPKVRIGAPCWIISGETMVFWARKRITTSKVALKKMTTTCTASRICSDEWPSYTSLVQGPKKTGTTCRITILMFHSGR